MNRFNSTIAVRCRACASCGKVSVIFSRNRCRNCAMKEDAKPIKTKVTYTKDDTLDAWFRERRKEMTGRCACGCGSGTSKFDDRYFKHSICHILEKRNVKSLKTHPLNFIELSYFNGCHTKFDNMGSSEWKKMKCFAEIVSRFKQMYPLILPEEMQYIPQILLNEL